MDNKYNGWANYETWNFKLWLDNDEASYKRIQELVKACNKDDFELASNLSDLAHNEAPTALRPLLNTTLMRSETKREEKNGTNRSKKMRLRE